MQDQIKKIPEFKISKGVDIIHNATSIKGLGDFSYTNSFNFYPETVTNGKCGEEFKGFCMQNRYCDEFGSCQNKVTAKIEDHKKNAIDNLGYRLCNNENDGNCVRYLQQRDDAQKRFTHAYNMFIKKF